MDKKTAQIENFEKAAAKYNVAIAKGVLTHKNKAKEEL
tara:strand:+ start:1911 stop:2024 length:114 start_codon:yes stop_codon:yes gene_type:complete